MLEALGYARNAILGVGLVMGLLQINAWDVIMLFSESC